MEDQQYLAPEVMAHPRWGRTRMVVAPIVGMIVGGVGIAAASRGIQYNYSGEPAIEEWGLLFWGDHYVIRTLSSLVFTAIGAIVAGTIARRSGWMIGLISSIPTIAVWIAALFIWTMFTQWARDFGMDPSMLSVGSKAITVIVPILTVFVAIAAGSAGEDLGCEYEPVFDSRRFSLLGVKWYHFAWIIPWVWVVVVESGSAIDYGLSWWRQLAWEEWVPYQA